jgi:signal peptidase I
VSDQEGDLALVSEPPPPGAGGSGPAAPPATPGPVARRRRRRRVLIEWLIVLAVALVLALGIRTFVVQAFYIPSGSMEPTLNIGDRILVQKLFFNYHDLHTGDIIVFHEPPNDACPPPETDLVKRVIGLPGQTIYSIGNTIYVNNKPLSEPWLPKGTVLGPKISQGSPQHPFKIPADSFYVLGDNRSISCDSRYWGVVPGKSIVGKVFLRWWHNNRPDLHFF